MKQVVYSERAEQDLADIAIYTTRQWGEEQCEKYTRILEAACEQLANQPMIGRIAVSKYPGLRRLKRASHVIFYQLREQDILILRVLHRSMLINSQRLGL